MASEAGPAHRDVSLDALRGGAVLAVVVHHAASLAGPQRAGWLSGPAEVLDVGVAVFFVLSGYLIYRPFAAAGAAGEPPASLRGYWWRRAVRILPAYWVALGGCWALGTFEPAGFTDLMAHVTLLNVYRPGSLFNGITQGWSLSVEVAFYLMIPLWSAFQRRRGPTTAGRELWGVAALVAAAHLFRAAVSSGDWTVGGASLRGMSFLWLPTHLDLLAAGMAVAVVSIHRDTPAMARLAHVVVGRRWAVRGVALAALAGYAATLGGPSIEDGYTLLQLEVRQVVYGLVGLAAVAPFALRPQPAPAGRRLRSLAWWAGALSYAVYLWHNDFMELVTRRAGAGTLSAWWGTGLGDMALLPLLGVGSLVAIAVAAVSWLVVERPASRIRHWCDGPRPFWSHLGVRQRTIAALAMVAVVIALPLRGLMTYQGPPMEEGFMLAFPEQLLAGRLPHRDFLHLYGPGSLWLLAGLYRVFGTSLTVERLVGLAQHVLVAVGMFALLAPWGRRLATSGAVVSVLILISPLGLSAMAWNGALAAAVCGLALLVSELRRGDEARIAVLAVAGALGGTTLLFRPDLVLAVTLGFGAAVAHLRGRALRAVLGGATAALLAYVPHVLTSGIEASFRGMFLEPVFELRGGRALPVPPSFGEVDGFLQRAGAIRVVGWPFPMLATSVQIHLWFWLVVGSCVVVVAVGWWARRSGSPRASVLWPLGLFAGALVSQAVQRPDTAHLSWVSGITFPVLMVGVVEVLEHRRVRSSTWRRRIAIGGAAVVLVGIIPFYPVRTYADLVTQSAGFNRFGFPIRRGERVFYYGSEAAAEDAQAVVERLEERSTAGQRLVVGPVDLSKTPYSDAFFYFLFPELPPGTRYIEMDPGIADAADSGLADELREADWLIRSNAWSGWDEPNDSRFAGSDEPNQVVEAIYCMELDRPTFQLLRRCRP